MLRLSCLSLVACIGFGLFSEMSVQAAPPDFLRMFRPAARVEANEGHQYLLSEEEGPWLILASTFVGDDAMRRAERLALEIRRELDMPAYIYKEQFDFTGSVSQRAEASRRQRYANAYQYEAYAVLVGEYDRVENENIDRDLHRIKTVRLPVFEDPDEIAKETNGSNPVTTVKAMSKKLLSIRKDKTLGPMATAFVTRNPLLPPEYFDAPEVDSFVRQLNEDKEYSLLTNKEKYTVIVASFAGLGTIVDGKKEKNFVPSGERLDRFAADVDKMTKQLRADGVEAYQFHDRFKSIVTIGSFPSLGRELPDGQFEYAPEIRRVMEKYRAFNPQFARSIPGQNGVAANHAASIPFDVEPAPIAVPRVSKRSLYNGAFGMK